MDHLVSGGGEAGREPQGNCEEETSTQALQREICGSGCVTQERLDSRQNERC